MKGKKTLNINNMKKSVSAVNAELANVDNASGNIQCMLASSKFVRFTKETNLDVKNKPKKDQKKDKFKITINLEALTKKLDNKEDLPLRELNELKKIYYQPEDYELEELMRESNKTAKYSKMSVRDIIYGIVLNRRDQLMKAVKGKENVNQIVKNVFENKEEIETLLAEEYCEENKEKDKKKVEINLEEKGITEVIESMQTVTEQVEKEFMQIYKKEAKLIDEIGNSMKEREREKEMKSKVKVKDNRSKSNATLTSNSFTGINKAQQSYVLNSTTSLKMNAGQDNEENANRIFSKEDITRKISNKKREKISLDKNKVSGFAVNRMNLANIISNKIATIGKNNHNSIDYWSNGIKKALQSKENTKNSMKQMYEVIKNDLSVYNDINGPLAELIEELQKNADGEGFNNVDIKVLNLVNVVVAIANKCNNIVDTMNTMWQYLINEYNSEKTAAIMGKKGDILKKKAMLKQEKMVNLSSQNQFISAEVWKEKSLFEKVMLRFKFTDFNQMPKATIWKKFKDNEKLEFLNMLYKYRFTRGKLLLQQYDYRNPQDLIGKINSFLYYNDKDKKGFTCYTKEEILEQIKANNSKTWNEHSDNIKRLTDILNKISENNGVIGIYYVRGQRIKCKGKSFKDIIINKKKKGKKMNNNKKKPNIKGRRRKYKRRNYMNNHNQEPPRQKNIYNEEQEERAMEEGNNNVMEINTDSHNRYNKDNVDVTQNIHNIHVNDNNNLGF